MNADNYSPHERAPVYTQTHSQAQTYCMYASLGMCEAAHQWEKEGGKKSRKCENQERAFCCSNIAKYDFCAQVELALFYQTHT